MTDPMGSADSTPDGSREGWVNAAPVALEAVAPDQPGADRLGLVPQDLDSDDLDPDGLDPGDRESADVGSSGQTPGEQAPGTLVDGTVGVTSVAAEAIRVLVVDDHALFRRGLQMVLEQETDIFVVGEAADGAEALERATETTPDIVLMDVRMPRRGGIETTAAIKEAVPSARIIMLTISDEEADLYDAIKAGAMGYLLKEISIEEVATSIRAVHGGQSLISPSMASKLISEFASMKRGDERSLGVPAPKLTDRELEVLKLVAKGLANKEIARELYISENTVKNHVRNLLEKLQLHTRLQAVTYALREKLLEI